jgi:hypothetical protein
MPHVDQNVKKPASLFNKGREEMIISVMIISVSLFCRAEREVPFMAHHEVPLRARFRTKIKNVNLIINDVNPSPAAPSAANTRCAPGFESPPRFFPGGPGAVPPGGVPPGQMPYGMYGSPHGPHDPSRTPPGGRSINYDEGYWIDFKCIICFRV